MNKKGFTIIELLIVLAIVGLILLVVLLALPQLQRSRRDFARTSYAKRLYGTFDEFYKNNGRYPNFESATEKANFENNYIPKEKDPSTGVNYDVELAESNHSPFPTDHTTVPAIGEVHIWQAHWCNQYGDSAPSDIVAPNVGTHFSKFEYAIVIGVEAGKYYCIDRHNV